MIRFDTDRLREILDTLSRNKSRTFLTGFGVFWGVFMLVGLIGGGDGLKELINKNLDGFATNSAVVWAQQTTIPYHGFRKGRQWVMNYDDVKRLKAHVPELDVVTPTITRWGAGATHGDKHASCTVKGVMPDMQEVTTPKMFYGRYINEMDISQGRKVCVIGKQVYKSLFTGGGDPCGQLIRIDSIYYNVVGVNYSDGNMNINGSDEQAVVLPITLVQQVYNRGHNIDLLCMTGKPGVKMSDITDRIRSVIAQAHDVSPKDDKGVMIFNTEMMFSMVDSMFRGVNILIWLVGIGTLLAGAIGVSNIMMVTVRERTTEIGIRRAIGATPRSILSQIISESILLTAIAGMSGILFVVLILQALEMANTTDGIVKAHFQISFWTAVGAVAMLSLLGVLAGLAPAMRAMRIKPVDAMRMNIRKTTVVTGKIEPRNEVNVKPQISGIITEILKEAGETVQQGEVIAKVKVIPDMGSLSAAQSRLRLAEINRKQAQTDYDREKALFDKGLVAADEYDKIAQALRQAREEVDAAQDNLEVVRDGVSKSNASASSTLIRSTITGLILDIPVKVGNSVILANTFNDGTTIATVANMNDLIFRGNIDETEVGRLSAGMNMKITIGALQDLKFDARLEYISPKATEQNGANQFEIKAAVNLPSSSANIRSGYSANAEIVLAEAKNVLAVPESAIEFEGNDTYVYVIKGEGDKQTYERRKVQTGISDGINIEIRSGVKQNERVRGPKKMVADDK